MSGVQTYRFLNHRLGCKYILGGIESFTATLTDATCPLKCPRNDPLLVSVLLDQIVSDKTCLFLKLLYLL